MDDRELYFVREYHRRLIDATRVENQIKDLRPARPGWSDYLLLHFGDSLIAIGERMKRGRSIAQNAQRADLTQECA